jgi:4-aminobutyrate aminotransferase-like enzyme/Ser/Thr protein kinase RdoA (MazF antagonist)
VSVLRSVPTMPRDRAVEVAREAYGVVATAHPLPGERDQNLRLDVEGRPAYVLKVANPLEPRELLDAQRGAAGRALAAGLPVQPWLPTLDGRAYADVDGHLVRLVGWLPGSPLADVGSPPTALLADLGRLLGRLARALDGYDHPAAHRQFHWDVGHAATTLADRRAAVADPDRRALVDDVLARLQGPTAALLPRLPRAVVHGDANDHNVLVDDGTPTEPGRRFRRVSGLLDFGDLVHTVVIAEVAVAAAYVVMGAGDPVAAAAHVVAGFHAERPLSDDELAVCWDLVRARLALSVCNAAVQHAERPDDPYLVVSEAAAWDALARTAAVHPRLAYYRLRAACGLDPHPAAAVVRAHLTATPPAPLLGQPWSRLRTWPVDLSVGSATLGADDASAPPARFEALLRADVDGDSDAVGVGGYGEARLVYTTDAYATADGAERRTVHLAVDVWAAAGTPLHAPHAGTVELVHDNAARLDYGPVVVLRHETPDGTPYFSLYGHLARESLAHVAPGDRVEAGDLVGWVGSPPTNGDWAPHVHVQVLLDLLDLGVDYPGVAPPSQETTWLGLSPDPALLLGLRPAVPGRPVERTLADRRRLLGPSLSLAYEEPLRIVRGLGARLYDDRGRAYLDGVNNVAHVGHANPHVVRAAARQAAVLSTNTRYLHDEVLRYAERVVATLPEPLSVCFLVNSGSEANELALRLVRTATGARDLVVLRHGYHGNTQGLVDVSPYKFEGPGGTGAPGWVHVADLPEPYRQGGYGADVTAWGVADVRRRVAEVAAAGRPLAGMIAEPMVGCGGQVVLPEGYLRAAADEVRAAGGLFVADEVQVGFGRVGPAFWGFATQGVVPDVVTMGKPAGNGHPLGVVVTTRAVADAFANGMEYFNTFGGNPVSAAAGNAVLDVLERDALPERAAVLGSLVLDGGRGLAERHELVGDVRGLGLYAGIELVRDRSTRAPAGPEAAYVVERAKDRGVLLSTDGPHHNVLKIKPPLVWTADDVDQLVTTLDRVLSEPALRRR